MSQSCLCGSKLRRAGVDGLDIDRHPGISPRLIQQALPQVLQFLLDSAFSAQSYGFRPGRRAQDAVLTAQSYVQSGRRVVVDVWIWRNSLIGSTTTF